MRYTGEAAMEERGLRDIERWKDKIEVRLDNRQVFFLFFGSALVGCLLFILGVVVGKRLDSRGRAAAPQLEDPLALLDRVVAAPAGGDDGLTFPRTLIRGTAAGGRAADGEKAALITKEPVAEPTPATPEPSASAKANEPAVSRTEIEAKAVKSNEGEAKATSVATTEESARAKPQDEARARRDRAERGDAGKESSDGSGDDKFTLQIGSFQDKAEAEAFATRFADESPVVVVSDIPGKGLWYRVRLGSFADNETAMKAKAAFERRHKMIAYVAPR